MTKDDFPTPEEIEAATKPAFGVFPRGRMQRAERFNDRQASADMPVAFTRGRVAGTLGLPGDIESLIRMVTGGENTLPNTEYFDKRLPLKIDTPQSRAAGNVGEVLASPAILRGVAGLPGAVKKAATDFVKAAGQPAANVVKNKGGNWLTGSVERSLEGLKQRVRTPGINGHTEQDMLADQSLNKWIDSNLTRYVKNQMATPEDPVRALAEQGITHNPRQAGSSERAVSSTNREWAAGISGFTPDTVAVSDAAKNWETLADSLVTPVPVKTLVNKPDWVNKLPEGSKIFDFSRYEGTGGPRKLGFDHIIDVLREDVAAGRIRPEQLSKISMEQAVRRVAEYDAEKAAAMQKVVLEQQAGLPTFKEYTTVPGTDLPNQKGLKWVELKAQDELPEGWDESGAYLLDPQGAKVGMPYEVGDPRYDNLAKALKYEGDTMGHCVGRYCDSVMRGEKQIYSLRDAKGEPHVTIEVQPNSMSEFDLIESMSGSRLAENGLLTPEQGAALGDRFTSKEFNEVVQHPGGYDGWLQEALTNPNIKEPPPHIVQIKGKGNAKPKDDYLPFVQDFVKSGKWGDVQEYRNAGLRPAKSVFNETERQTLASKGVTDLPEYLAPDEINQYQRMFDDKLLRDLGVEGYAAGGRVSRNAPSMADAARGLFDMGASTLRGGVAGLAGLPGDLEELARSLLGAENKTATLPTSDFYKEWLPKASQDPVMDKTFGGVGEILGAPPVGKALSAGTTTLAKELAPTAARMAEQRLADQGLLLSVIKPKGGQWLNPPQQEMAKIKRNPGAAEQLEQLRQLRAAEPTPDPRTAAQFENAERNLTQKAALNSWIDSTLSKYVQRDMATPDDPLRKLLENEGIGHEDWAQFGGGWVPQRVADRRARMKFPEDGMALKRLEEMPGIADDATMERFKAAEGFETMMDDLVSIYPASTYQDSYFMANRPWLAKLDPNEPVYNLDQGSGAMGRFDDLAESLMKDMKEGILRPEQLSKVSIEQAVRRSAERRAKEAAEAALKSVEGMPVVKDYPDTGYKWIQLKGEKGDGKLEQALKFEGKDMAHCVGTYCDDVTSGRSEIFTLRDAKGRPHVTIEVEPRPTKDASEFYSANEAAIKDPSVSKFLSQVQESAADDAEYISQATEILKQAGLPVNMPTDRIITQIKGKGNARPKDDYLPMVHDFVRSQKWKGVNDLENTNLKQAGPYFVTEDEMMDIAKPIYDGWQGTETPLQYYRRIRRYPGDQLMGPDEQFLKAVAERFGGDKPGFAAGGTVKVAKEGVDLLRRKFFGGPALTKTEVAVSPTSVESKMVEEGPAAIEKVVKKVEETPMTRRQLLSRAVSSVASPMLRQGLPAELAKLSVSNIAKSATLPTTMPGLMAYALKKGMSEGEAIRFVRANMAREDGMLEDLITGLKSPYAIEMEEPAGRLDVMRQAMGSPSMSMKQVLREVKTVDPEAYGRVKNFASDMSKYGFGE